MNGYKFYFDKDFNYLLKEELINNNEFIAKRYAKSRLRMYANLFNRGMRKQLLNDKSICNYCGSTEKLEIDHIVSISKGGKNNIDNIQILCESCNIKKR